MLTADGTEYVQEASIRKSSSASATLTFSDIRVGARAKVSVKVLIGDYEYASGESDEVIIKEGQNQITIKLGKNAALPIILYSARNPEYLFKLDTKPDSSGYYKVMVDTDAPISFDPKAKFFGFINGNESPAGGDITLELVDYDSGKYKTPVYSFGEDCIYWLYDNKIQVYKAPDYEKSSELDLIEKFTNTITVSGDCTIEGLAYYSGSLYFFIKASGDSESYYFAAYNLAEDTILYAQEEDEWDEHSCDSLDVTKIGDKYVLCSINNNPNVLYIQPFTIDGSSLNLGGSFSQIYVPIDYDTDLYEPFYKIGFGGLQILGNTLYVTCYFYRDAGNGISPYFLGSEHIGRIPVLSAGGVGKINLAASTYEFSNWSNGEKLLGLYKDYYYDQNSETGKFTKSDYAVIMAPPENLSSGYFYGAKRFIAKKPDELIIADDGAYVELEGSDGEYPKDSDALKRCVNKNRVVTINLKNESISAVDVNASFSSTLVGGTCFGID